jgi:hypothetical protein
VCSTFSTFKKGFTKANNHFLTLGSFWEDRGIIILPGVGNAELAGPVIRAAPHTTIDKTNEESSMV